MRFTVIGVIDGRRMETVVRASNVVDAIKAAEASGMVVTDVHAPPPDPRKSLPPETVDPPARKPGTDSPILCGFVGLLIPFIGVLVALVKCRKDPVGAAWALIGAVAGFLLWGGVASGL